MQALTTAAKHFFLLQTAQSVFMATFPTFQTQRRATTYIFAEPENYM
jgi:hypothetical protein